MNIAELAERVATEQSLDKAQTRKVIEAALKAVVDAAKDGAEVSLPGFGKFKVQDRPGARGLLPCGGGAVGTIIGRLGDVGRAAATLVGPVACGSDKP